jgi:N-acetylmuramoyl-L-alanine amidase
MDYLFRDVMDYIKKIQGALTAILLLFSITCAFSAPVQASSSAAEAFQSANAASVDLFRDLDKKKDRVSWMAVIQKYLVVSKNYPQTRFAPTARFKAAKLSEELYRFSSNHKDIERAADIYVGIADEYSSSSLADDALYRAAQIYNSDLSSKQKAFSLYQRVIADFPDGDMVQLAREQLNALNLEKRAAGIPSRTDLVQLGQVRTLRQWSNKDYTRVVIDLEKDISFKTFTLPPDASAGKPERLVIELSNARLAPELSPRIHVNDGIITDIRASQYKSSKVRVVLDLSQKSSYRAFPLEDPSRLVVDISRDAGKSPDLLALQSPSATSVDGKKTGHVVNTFKKVPKWSKSQMSEDVPSIAAQLSLRVSKIVIDPGHGGKDPGAIGPNGLVEKDLTLTISKQLAKRLKLEGFTVYLTRDSDVFIPLEERTAFANKKKADLFVSVHINSLSDQSAAGIETYFLNLTTDSSAIEVAARENATTSKSISDLQLIINDLMLNSKINESSRFANCIHKCIISQLLNNGYRGKDYGVKQAPFYVLLGAQMPSILVELGFITNSMDSSLLQSEAHQSTLIDGIAKGINKYIMNTTYAYFRRNP